MALLDSSLGDDISNSPERHNVIPFEDGAETPETAGGLAGYSGNPIVGAHVPGPVAELLALMGVAAAQQVEDDERARTLQANAASPKALSTDSTKETAATVSPSSNASWSPEGGCAGKQQHLALRHVVLSFFEGLPDNLRGRVWQTLLGGHLSDAERADLEEFMLNGRLDEPNQVVIRSDVDRTRAHLTLYRGYEARQLMERLLTFYCKKRGFRYKQGLNEVIAPFVYLLNRSETGANTSSEADSQIVAEKSVSEWASSETSLPVKTGRAAGEVQQSSVAHTSPDVFSVADVYGCFAAFVGKFLPMFSDDDFRTLQCSFYLFKHLLVYHDPRLATFLEGHGISPELYVTPWFLTLFASKLQINHLLCLWDFYIAESDRYFFCFLSLALLLDHRTQLMETELSKLPETLTSLCVHSYEHLNTMWQRAHRLKAITPTSFASRLSSSTESHSVSTSLSKLENETAFAILPQEVLRHCYCFMLPPQPSAFGGHPGGNTTNSTASRGLRHHFLWKLLILDLRPRVNFESGHLPPAINVDVTASDWRARLRDVAASVLGPMPQTKHSQNIAVSVEQAYHVCVMAADSSESQVQLASYVHGILTREHGLPLVSVARGGFREVHQLAVRSGLELVDHVPAKCAACELLPPPAATSSSRRRGGATVAASLLLHNFSRSGRDVETRGSPRRRGSAAGGGGGETGVTPTVPDTRQARLGTDGKKNSDGTLPIRPMMSPGGASKRSYSLSHLRTAPGCSPSVRGGCQASPTNDNPKNNINHNTNTAFSLISVLKLVGGRSRQKRGADTMDPVTMNNDVSRKSLDNSLDCEGNEAHRSPTADPSRLSQPTSEASGLRDSCPGLSGLEMPLSTAGSRGFSDYPDYPQKGENGSVRLRRKSSTAESGAMGKVSTRLVRQHPMLLKPHFLSGPGPASGHTIITPIEPAQWRILGRTFRRFPWPAVNTLNVHLFQCRIESMRLEEAVVERLLQKPETSSGSLSDGLSASTSPGSIPDANNMNSAVTEVHNKRSGLEDNSRDIDVEGNNSPSRSTSKVSTLDGPHITGAGQTFASPASLKKCEEAVEHPPFPGDSDAGSPQDLDLAADASADASKHAALIAPFQRLESPIAMNGGSDRIPSQETRRHHAKDDETSLPEGGGETASTVRSKKEHKSVSRQKTFTDTQQKASNMRYCVPDARTCQLLLTEREVALLSVPYPKGFVLLYANYPLVNIVKITSKKASADVLFFYFSDKKGFPELALRFPDAGSAQTCINAVREIYRAIRAKGTLN